jgi:hypothetical protein
MSTASATATTASTALTDRQNVAMTRELALRAH